MIRAVLDANVFISALIRPEGPPGKILVAFVERRAFALLVSPAIIDELRRSLAEPRLGRHLRLTAQEREAWIASVENLAENVAGKRRMRVVEADPDDDKYFSAALEGEADVIVSGHRHVLDVGRYERIRVLTPRTFLEMLG